MNFLSKLWNWLKKAKVETGEIELGELGKQKNPWDYKPKEESEKITGVKVTLPWPGEDK